MRMNVAVQEFLSNLTQRPGVYRMYAQDDELLYVGKAKNLKNRVQSYFRARNLDGKTVALVSKIARIEVTVTASEAEALLLEQTLIKKHRPHFNILFKDSKSYPYLHLSEHAYPLLAYRRMRGRVKGRYFGPYPNSTAVRETLNYLQKLFQLRSCSDSYFANRSRACLQYQIKRCSAPCVNLVSAEQYAQDTHHAELFLQGQNQALLHDLHKQMQQAAAELEFEQAARLRDKIDMLRQIQQEQHIESEQADADIWAMQPMGEKACLHRLAFRQGRLQTSQSFYPENKAAEENEQFFANYISQYYFSSTLVEGMPKELVCPLEPEFTQPIADAIYLQFKQRLKLSMGKRGKRRQWLQMAQQNAHLGSQQQSGQQQMLAIKLTQLTKLLALSQQPNRIECFDISHAQGEDTYASCVVHDAQGLAHERYRRFKIKGIQAGDDYAALEQAVRRHFTRMQEQQDVAQLLLIDGGKGQIARVQRVLDELQLSQVQCFGISKGETRKSGWEHLWQPHQAQPIMPNAHDAGFQLLQQIRDEAHRFAISGHRKARAKKRIQSDIQEMAGIGPKRRRELLIHFGSLSNMKSAPVDEIAKVSGISQTLANKIYRQLHGE